MNVMLVKEEEKTKNFTFQKHTKPKVTSRFIILILLLLFLAVAISAVVSTVLFALDPF